MLTVVDQFVFRWCEVVAGAVQASVVVPVDPFQGGEFDVVEAAPRAPVVDQFGLKQADFGFGQSVVQRVARSRRWVRYRFRRGVG